MSIRIRSITDLMSKEAIGKALTEYYNTETDAQKERRIQSLVTQKLSESDSDIEEIAENYNSDANENPKVIYGGKDSILFGFSPDTAIDNMGTDNSFLEKQFKCNSCEKTFNQKSVLIRHEISHTGEKPFECSICEKRYTKKVTLNNHMKVHYGIYDHVCCICKKCFTDKSNLNVHMKIHYGIYDHVCYTCKKSFTDKSNLNKHMKIHTNDRPYSCDICGKTFQRKYDMTKHKKGCEKQSCEK